MRILSSDDKRAVDTVRDMEARGYELVNVDISGAHDITADELAAYAKSEKSAKRSRAFWRIVGLFASLVLVYLIT